MTETAQISENFTTFVPININSKNQMPNNRKNDSETGATFRAKPIVGQFLMICNGLAIHKIQ